MKVDVKNIGLQLENRMFESFTCVNENKNVVLKDLSNLSKEQLVYTITQYSQFPRNIVSILVGAAYNFGYHGWTEFVNELRDNVFQELGGGFGNIASDFGPHYSILRRELQNVFDVDIRAYKSSVATTKFLESIKLLVESDPLRAAGSLFALEASAVPELAIVMKLVNDLANRYEKKLTKNLANFFQFHIDVIEVGHRDRLIELVVNQLSEPSSFECFVSGYDSVLRSMDIWWSELHLETQNQQTGNIGSYESRVNNSLPDFTNDSNSPVYQ